jgi:hypothetical protein
VPNPGEFLRNFYGIGKNLFSIFTAEFLCFQHPLIGDVFMEIAYIVGCLVLWGAMALMVHGFKKLEKPQGERP